MDTTLPADLLKLKAQFDAWHATRTKRSRVPEPLRQQALALLDRYSAALLCRVFRLHSRALQTTARASAPPPPTPASPAADFYPLLAALPPGAAAPTLQCSPVDCRLLLEHPDGRRLTLILPALEPAALAALCASFWRA